MAWLIQEVPDPKESVGCGSIILTIIGAIIIIWAISSSDKSESHDTDSPSIPIEPKTEQVQQSDVKKSVSPTSQTNLPLKANPAAAPANTAKPQIKATVSPTKKVPHRTILRRTLRIHLQPLANKLNQHPHRSKPIHPL